MRKLNPKEKDNALEYFYGRSNSVKPSQEIIDILIAEGYMELRTSVNGSAYWITDKGKGFILQGGYTKERNIRRKQTFTFYLNMVLSALISAIVAYIVSSLNTGN